MFEFPQEIPPKLKPTFPVLGPVIKAQETIEVNFSVSSHQHREHLKGWNSIFFAFVP